MMGTNFTNKFTGTSSLSSSAEKYTLPAGTEGRYVRVIVNGNTENEWASINEISVVGGAPGSSGGGSEGFVGRLYHKWQTSPSSSTWSNYESLGGGIRPSSDLALAMNTDDRLQVFVIGTNNALYYKTQTLAGSSTWSGWTSLGEGIKADTGPAVARNTDGRLQVFVVGTNNQLYFKTQTAVFTCLFSNFLQVSVDMSSCSPLERVLSTLARIANKSISLVPTENWTIDRYSQSSS